MNRTDLDHRLARVREPLVVPAGPPVPTEPGERPLHHPASWQLHEPHTPGGTTHHLDPITGLGLHQPAVEMMIVVLAVAPQQLQPTSMFGGQSAQDRGG